jgi:hypothetical protein
MSTLNVVEKVLRERRVPMVVREIVEAAGPELPTKSRTPDTVVARDLAMDIKKHGEESKFIRTSPGKYTLRELAAPYLAAGSAKPTDVVATQPSAPAPQHVDVAPIPVTHVTTSETITH